MPATIPTGRPERQDRLGDVADDLSRAILRRDREQVPGQRIDDPLGDAFAVFFDQSPACRRSARVDAQSQRHRASCPPERRAGRYDGDPALASEL